MNLFGLGILGIAIVLALVVVAVAIVALVAFFIVTLTRNAGRLNISHGLPVPKAQVYFKRQYLFSRGEAAFYRVLCEAVDGEYLVMGKVRLSDLVDARSPDWRTRTTSSNRINQKHVDFVLLDPRELTVKLVIELDDRSHLAQRRQDRDVLVDQALREAGVPILHVPAAAQYGAQGIRVGINAALSARAV